VVEIGQAADVLWTEHRVGGIIICVLLRWGSIGSFCASVAARAPWAA
jgi:hypothetical protein